MKDLLRAEEVFDIGLFDESPQVFYKLVHLILPDATSYTPTHGFIRLLQDKSKLQTNYTQNIDNIEEQAGIDKGPLNPMSWLFRYGNV